MTDESASPQYAHLPEDLIKRILDAAPATVEKMNKMFAAQNEPIKRGIESLRDAGFIKKAAEEDFTDSLIAVDGGNIVERMSGADLLLAAAVGVEGLTKRSRHGWGKDRNQYCQWQTVLPHEEAAARLCQGVMFMMELSVLAGADYEIRIMDGAHFTPILKINSMLTAKEENAGAQYADALREFLGETYKKTVPDIPDMISDALNNESVIAIAKYSSSRDVLDAHVRRKDITLDDKTFFALGLEENEYVGPFTVGQSSEERRKIWNDLHIRCNIKVDRREELNERLKAALNPLRTKSDRRAKKSELWFLYYKPYQDGPAYRIECKGEFARDRKKRERMLVSVKRQIAYPDIREPFPQYLADIMAKSVSGGLFALLDAIRLSPEFSVDGGRLDLLFPYRSR